MQPFESCDCNCLQGLGDIDEDDDNAPKQEGAMRRMDEPAASSNGGADGSSNGHHSHDDDVLGAQKTPLKSIGVAVVPCMSLAVRPVTSPLQRCHWPSHEHQQLSCKHFQSVHHIHSAPSMHHRKPLHASESGARLYQLFIF